MESGPSTTVWQIRLQRAGGLVGKPDQAFHVVVVVPKHSRGQGCPTAVAPEVDAGPFADQIAHLLGGQLGGPVDERQRHRVLTLWPRLRHLPQQQQAQHLQLPCAGSRQDRGVQVLCRGPRVAAIVQKPRHAPQVALGGCVPEARLPMTVAVVGIGVPFQQPLDELFLVSAQVLSTGHLVQQLPGGLVVIPPGQRPGHLLRLLLVLLSQQAFASILQVGFAKRSYQTGGILLPLRLVQVVVLIHVELSEDLLRIGPQALHLF
mmetsp:Transcript_66995/g.159862  ORF Transcript_66995/g.159862 Transcript_66995/m.159862 type:complete len:262 (+) Transcript_66995:1729-2514(+)